MTSNEALGNKAVGVGPSTIIAGVGKRVRLLADASRPANGWGFTCTSVGQCSERRNRSSAVTDNQLKHSCDGSMIRLHNVTPDSNLPMCARSAARMNTSTTVMRKGAQRGEPEKILEGCWWAPGRVRCIGGLAHKLRDGRGGIGRQRHRRGRGQEV